MADVVIRLGYFTVAQFAANPTLVLEAGQHIHLSDGADEFVDAYVIGDGTTQLQNLDWKGLKTGSAPTEEIFTNETGSNITLSTTPNFVIVYMNGQKLTATIDYTITTNEITFLYTFDSSTITVIKF